MVILAIALNSEAENRFIEIPALGRPFSLGDLYDMTKDTRIEGPKLWEQKKLDDFVQEGTPNTDSDIIAAESFSEQKSKFDINARIGMSFLSGLIKVEGSAGYLDDRIKTSNTARVSLRFMSKTYKRSFKPETLTIVDYPQVLKKVTEATHVVAGIQYGAGAIFVFDRHINNNEVKKDVQGSMNIAVKSIPGFEISGEGKVIMTEEDKKNDDRFSCSFHGDFVLKNQPTSYKEAILVYKELPGLLGDNYENAVPMTIFLYPLDALPLDKAAAVLQEIKSTVVAQVTKEIETLDSIIRSCNDILGTDVAYYHERIRRNVADFQKYVEDYKGLFQEDLQKVLPKIRNNTLPDSALTALLNDKSDSPFSSLSLERWIEDLKKETGVLQATQNLPNYCKNDGELSQKLLKGPEHSVVLHLKLDIMDDEYVTSVMKQDIEKKRKDANTFSLPSSRYKWWGPSSPTFQDLKTKMTAFEAYYKEESTKTEKGLKSDVQFLVLESPLDPLKKGADRGIFVEVYKQGLLSERDYAIPFMSSKPVLVKKKFDQILLSWKIPEKRENIFFYEISPFVRNDTAENGKDLYIPLATIKTSGHIDDNDPNILMEYIKNLESDQSYYFKVSVYCNTHGKTSTSIESEFIQTEPCPAGMYHQYPHTCQLCPSGHYNERVGAKNCLTCPEGTYREDLGAKSADECQPCPQGTFNNVRGSISVSSCQKCPAGTYNDKKQSVSNADCVRCPPGTYSEMKGQTSGISCIPCKAGTYNENEGATRCVLCPDGTSSKTQGAKGQDECGEGATTAKLELEMAGIKTELGDLSANVASIQGLKTEIGDLSANVARIQGLKTEIGDLSANVARIQGMKTELSDLSAIVARIQGYESLRGKCFHNITRGFYFVICPYGENHKKTKTKSISIGKYKGWKDGVIGGTMWFADGDGEACGSFGKRRSEVIFTCGDSNTKIHRILEPELCHYVIEMQTKLACGVNDDRLKNPGHTLADLAQKGIKSFTPKIVTKGTWPWS